MAQRVLPLVVLKGNALENHILAIKLFMHYNACLNGKVYECA